MNDFEDLGKVLQLKFPELGTLIKSLEHMSSQYDFFRTLAVHIIPAIRKNQSFKPLINRWEREIRASKKELGQLQIKALEEVSSAFQVLANRIENNDQVQVIPVIWQKLEEAKGYLEGTRLVYTPSHFEMAADALAATCRLLLQHNASELFEGLAEAAYLNNAQTCQVLKKCFFYENITKIIKIRQNWNQDTYHLPYTCWCYLKFTELLWDLPETAFEGKELKSSSIEECHETSELMGLHANWIEIQSIRSGEQEKTPFFTIERFTKYLQVICNEILMLESRNALKNASLGIVSLSLKIDGEYLLLLIEKNDGITKKHLLHKFNGITRPCRFFKYLIDNPGKDANPSDFEMKANSPSNLLARSRIKDPLQKLFFRKGTNKGSRQLHAAQIYLENQELSIRLSLENHIEQLNLPIYEEK